VRLRIDWPLYTQSGFARGLTDGRAVLRRVSEASNGTRQLHRPSVPIFAMEICHYRPLIVDAEVAHKKDLCPLVHFFSSSPQIPTLDRLEVILVVTRQRISFVFSRFLCLFYLSIYWSWPPSAY